MAYNRAKILKITSVAVIACIAMTYGFVAKAGRGVTPASQFFWGVGNSAFQVEGSPADSDWYRWTHTPGKIKDGTNADTATDFWNRYEEDFELARSLKSNMFRMSLAWERIEPSPGVWDEAVLDHYEKMIARMRDYGLEPLITIEHFVLPVWLAEKGGLTAKNFPQEFVRYATKVVNRLAPPPARVKWWLTMNEPMGQVYTSYMSPLWPPGVEDGNLAAVAGANYAEAHILAYQEIKGISKKLFRSEDELKVGLAMAWPLMGGRNAFIFDPVIGYLANWSINYQFMNSLRSGHIFMWVVGSKAVDRRIPLKQRGTLDFLGINYYTRKFMTLDLTKKPILQYGEGPGPKTDIGWEYYPQGMVRALKSAWRYRIPILVTENGVADQEDRLRPWFLRGEVAAVREARREGIDVIGYLHWSLTDNFEWAEGQAMRFGLVDVNYSSLKKTPRPSFDVYRELIETGIE
jgi:beta-glucosidase